MSYINKFLSAVAPKAALKRELDMERLKLQTQVARRQNDIINSGYGNHGASYSKNALAGWDFYGGGADEDIHAHLDVLRQRSRDNYMGVPLATGAIKTMRTNIVGPGLQLKSQIDGEMLGMSEEEARKLEQQIEREFNLWADSTNCDLERQDNFSGLQQVTCLNWLMSGDVVALLPTTIRPNSPYDLRVQLIEADRVSTPEGREEGGKITGGVEVDNTGEVIAYHISNVHPLSDDTNKDKKWNKVEAYGKKTGRQNIIHVMNKERIGQKRGVPFLAPVIEVLKQLGRYTESELMATVISSFFTVFIEKEEATGGDGPPLEGIIPVDGVKLDYNPAKDKDIGLAPGAIVDLAVGEKANFANPQRPGTQFNDFTLSVIRQIGAALEIPHEILIKEFSKSFTASRGALLEFWKSVTMYRAWLVDDFCKPIFKEFMREAVAKGRITAPGFFSDPLIEDTYCRAIWTGPAQGVLNPLQEIKAAESRINLGMSTREREAAEMNGSNFADNVRKLKQENKLIKETKGEDGNA